LPHALALLEQAKTDESSDLNTAYLLLFVVHHLDSRGAYSTVEPLYRRALEIRQRMLGADHPSTATRYNNVASNLNAQGKYEEAEPLYRGALEILKATLPPTHPHIETVQTSLQQLHAKMGQ
jgi:tetratricopeptide (TPR) repeat protein